IARMSEIVSRSVTYPDSYAEPGRLPLVRLQMHGGTGHGTVYDVSDLGFLIGSVPGCDLRLPGVNLPPVICLIGRHADGASLRKLVATYPVAVNGQPIANAALANGDRITLGAMELLVRLESVAIQATTK